MILIIVIIIQLYFLPQPIDQNIQIIQHDKIYTIVSKISIISSIKNPETRLNEYQIVVKLNGARFFLGHLKLVNFLFSLF